MTVSGRRAVAARPTPKAIKPSFHTGRGPVAPQVHRLG